MILDILDHLADTLRDIRKLHRKDPAGYCRECTVDWPCRTFELADNTLEP